MNKLPSSPVFKRGVDMELNLNTQILLPLYVWNYFLVFVDSKKNKMVQ